jgi:predicted PurR-regulated permease PerM
MDSRVDGNLSDPLEGAVLPLPSPEDALPPVASRGYRSAALAALTVGLVILCFLLALPFLSAIAWGVALAVIAWPLHRWIRSQIGNETFAAVVSTAIVATILLAAGLFIANQLLEEGAKATEQAKNVQAQGELKSKIASVPFFAPLISWMDRVGLDPETEVRKIITGYTKDFSSLAQGSVAAGIQFLAAIFILFYAFRDRWDFVHGLRDLLPLSRAETDRVMKGASDSIHANLYATLITSLTDSIILGSLFWWTGLPAPVLWTVTMFFLAFLPVVGAGLVWIPAAIYLLVTGNVLGGLTLFGAGAVTFVLVDNFLYAKLAAGKMRMHEVPALLAFFGGLAYFGFSGMVLGPATLAVTMAVIEVWKSRLSGVDDPTKIVSPAEQTANV